MFCLLVSISDYLYMFMCKATNESFIHIFECIDTKHMQNTLTTTFDRLSRVVLGLRKYFTAVKTIKKHACNP